MSLIRRSPNYVPRSKQSMNAALVDLPEIDYEKGREMLQADCFSTPEGWPRNWQWLIAIKDAQERIAETERQLMQAKTRIEDLRHSICSFRDFLDRGWLWPGLEEHRVACLKGGYETAITTRNEPAREAETTTVGSEVLART